MRIFWYKADTISRDDSANAIWKGSKSFSLFIKSHVMLIEIIFHCEVKPFRLTRPFILF